MKIILVLSLCALSIVVRSQVPSDTSIHLDSLTKAELDRNLGEYQPRKSSQDTFGSRGLVVHGHRGSSNSIRVNGVEITDPLTGRTGSLQQSLSRLAISEIKVISGDSAHHRTRAIWVPRDSNALWSHRGPDTGMIMLTIKRGMGLTGHLISRDSQWVTLVGWDGEKHEIQASQIKAVSDLVTVPDTVRSVSRLPMTTLNSVYSTPHFEAYFAPTVLGGIIYPTGSGGSGFFGSALALLAFRIPHVLYSYLGEFFGVSYESRSFRTTPTASQDDYWNVRYVAMTPGISYRGILSIGLTVGIPVGADLTSFGSTQLYGATSPLRSTMSNLLLEPKVIVGWPLTSQASDGGLLLLAEAGYPLGNAFSDLPSIITGLTSSQPNTANFMRLPQISLGLSYVVRVTSYPVQLVY